MTISAFDLLSYLCFDFNVFHFQYLPRSPICTRSASQSQASCRHTLLPLCQHIHLPTYQLCLLLALPPSVLLLRRRQYLLHPHQRYLLRAHLRFQVSLRHFHLLMFLHVLLRLLQRSRLLSSPPSYRVVNHLESLRASPVNVPLYNQKPHPPINLRDDRVEIRLVRHRSNLWIDLVTGQLLSQYVFLRSNHLHSRPSNLSATLPSNRLRNLSGNHQSNRAAARQVGPEEFRRCNHPLHHLHSLPLCLPHRHPRSQHDDRLNNLPDTHRCNLCDDHRCNR